MMNFHDVEWLKTGVRDLPVSHRVAFAAACCERLLPNYEGFSAASGWGEPALLRDLLDSIWSDVNGDKMPVEKIRSAKEACLNALPDTEDFTSVFATIALYSGLALVHTLESLLDDDPEHVALVRQSSFEALISYLAAVNDPETEVHATNAEFENQLANFPLMQAELTKQEQDLDFLKSVSELDHATISYLRSSSAKMGIRPLDRGLLVINN